MTSDTEYINTSTEHNILSYEEATLRKERRMRCIEASVSILSSESFAYDLGAGGLSNAVRSMANDFYSFVEYG